VTATTSRSPGAGRARVRRRLEPVFWYVLLSLISVVTVFPFVWMLLTSLKGPTDQIFSVPPQLLPGHPTLANYGAVLDQLPVPNFFLNSITVGVAVTALNVLVAALAAYPLAKLKFFGREAIFYLLLGTIIVPARLTYIPSFVMAVNVFHYYDSLPALILPNLASAFNIFLLRQAFRGVPNDLIDAARMDGASELAHAWWDDRLAPGWQPHTREQNQDILDRLGLTGDFWRL
jgi:putative chitobiose transport system permease protein